jgi:hypothetical protein
MEIYTAFMPEEYDTLTDTSTLVSGAVIFVVLVALCLLTSKAIDTARNKRNADGKEPSDHATSRPSADGYGCGLGNFASMIVAAGDDPSSGDASRKMRKATKARRKAT